MEEHTPHAWNQVNHEDLVETLKDEVFGLGA